MFEKIKSVRPLFHPGCGPGEVVTLGIKFGDRSYIFGEYYTGSYAVVGHSEEKDETEAMIDRIVRRFKEGE